MIPCAGIIVFDQDNTILVRTSHGNHSFPKGKREKGESYIVAAWRELQEETGLTQMHIELLDNVFFDELSGKGNPSVRYFVGRLTVEIDSFTFNKNELENVSWVNVNDAYKIEKFKDSRKAILKEAYNKL